MGSLSPKTCCKNPILSRGKEINNDDVIDDNQDKDSQRNNIKIISPYFQQFVTVTNQTNRDNKLKTDTLEDSEVNKANQANQGKQSKNSKKENKDKIVSPYFKKYALNSGIHSVN